MKKETPKYIEELRISHIINDVMATYIDSKKNQMKTIPKFTETELEEIKRIKPIHLFIENMYHNKKVNTLSEEDGRFNRLQIPFDYIIEHQEIDNLLVLIVPISLSKEQIGEITTILHSHYYIKVRQEHSLDKDIKFNILAFKKKVN